MNAFNDGFVEGLLAQKSGRRYSMESRRQRINTMMSRYGTLNPSAIECRMYVSPWFVAPADGLPTRIVRQAEPA